MFIQVTTTPVRAGETQFATASDYPEGTVLILSTDKIREVLVFPGESVVIDYDGIMHRISEPISFLRMVLQAYRYEAVQQPSADDPTRERVVQI